MSQLLHAGLANGVLRSWLVGAQQVRLQDLEGEPASSLQGAAASLEVHSGFHEWGYFS